MPLETPLSSWFHDLTKIASNYGFPTPLSVLLNPGPTSRYKNPVKTAITASCHSAITLNTSLLPSLSLFYPNFLLLGLGPHPLLTTCSSEYSIYAANIQAKLFSRRYCSDTMSSHWTYLTKACRLHGCPASLLDMVHQLTSCKFLVPKLQTVIERIKLSFYSIPTLLQVFLT